MRLRVVPGFISPPPGFGGLGYTPTARQESHTDVVFHQFRSDVQS